MNVTIVYDNNICDSRLTPGWGFSCLVKLPQKTILFDTGGEGTVLLHNMSRLGIDPREIDIVVLSHAHGDHVGGLDNLLKYNSDVTVYMPLSFPRGLKDLVTNSGAKVKEVNEASELFDSVFTTGELDGGIKEQSLALMTPNGLVVVTGCAHPGVVNIAKKAQEIMMKDIYLLVGGFHMVGTSTSHIKDTIDKLQQLGVKKVAPCHCSGEEARKLFCEYFGDNYIECGAGKELGVG